MRLYALLCASVRSGDAESVSHATPYSYGFTDERLAVLVAIVWRIGLALQTLSSRLWSGVSVLLSGVAV
jgi:hypothetical protein